MKIETLEFAGLYSATHGMRNPMDSWAKSDSEWVTLDGPYEDDGFNPTYCEKYGDADKDLSERLQKAGPEHCKHLRMIMVYADITAPRYWWTEFDTYRAGVEKVSCSTMHRLMARPLTENDFENDCMSPVLLNKTIENLNSEMELYKTYGSTQTEAKKVVWRGIIQGLPQSYLQKRTVMMSYAALRNIYRQRKGHKLIEWQIFREWVEALPESWMITDVEEEQNDAE